MNSELPIPCDAALAHSRQLQQLICDEIDRQGPMTFARYMEMALYQPGLGYYRCGAQKFGAAGDFITAPEFSPLFAGCLAKRCASWLSQGYHDLWEIGAGSGVLAVELMQALEKQGQLPEHYYILELSSELKQRQQQLVRKHIPHLFENFVWLQDWPVEFNGVVIANELFDAMPVHYFLYQDGLKEFYVTHHYGELQWHVDEPSTPRLERQLTSYDCTFAEGYRSEVNLCLPEWVRGLCGALQQAQMIFIDYGYKREAYYHAERSMGTLMCHLQHRAHDNPLLYPGIQDITAHVDFTLVAESAAACGAQVVSFNSQSQYLILQGITDLVSDEDDPHRQLRLSQQVKQLVMPNQMGESFKVIELEYHR